MALWNNAQIQFKAYRTGRVFRQDSRHCRGVIPLAVLMSIGFSFCKKDAMHAAQECAAIVPYEAIERLTCTHAHN
jgi:hypothetical protein